jgi:membrane-associated phospholipid phosphatase
MAGLGLMSLVAALRMWLQWVGPLPGDRYAAAHFGRPWSDGSAVRGLTAFLSTLGVPLVAAVLACAGLMVLWFCANRRISYGLIAACLVIPINALLKLLSGPTPLWTGTHHVGHNFPSGHVAFITSVIGYLGWVAARQRQPVITVLALLLVLGMGPARVVAGAHLVSDVIAGYLVGGAVLVLAVAVARRERAGAA